MKRTPLKRKVSLKAKRTLKRSSFKRKPTVKKKKTKLPPYRTVRNKCDKLLTPIIKEMHPYCFLQMAENCEKYTQVAHHHVLKSKCTALRYEIENLIPLCNRCHMLLHSHETFYSSVIVERKGLEWWEKLKKRKNEEVKADVHFYLENLERLQKIYNDLTT